MKMKTDDVLIYKDSQIANRYGTGVVTLITPDEYTILWSGRGLRKYRRSILDKNLELIFQLADKGACLPKERQLQLGAKVRVPFNENYDRPRLALLCEKLKISKERKAKDVAEGLTSEFFRKKLLLRGPAKVILCQLAELCDSKTSTHRDDARSISRELFFGYVLQKSDFYQTERE